MELRSILRTRTKSNGSLALAAPVMPVFRVIERGRFAQTAAQDCNNIMCSPRSLIFTPSFTSCTEL